MRRRNEGRARGTGRPRRDDRNHICLPARCRRRSSRVTQGIGAALFEKLVYDEQGQLQATTFADYLLPAADVVSCFTLAQLHTPSSHSPAGIKGMGESGMIAAFGGVVNAVNDALASLGATLREIPLTPERVLAALDAAAR